MRKIAREFLQKLIVGIAVVIIGILAMPLCICLVLICAIWSAADAAIKYLE